jgi:chitinase
MDWNTNIISSQVTGPKLSIFDSRPNGLDTITLAFATGECGSEIWGSIDPNIWIPANLKNFEQAGLNYIISTGGANGIFTCGTPEKFIEFIQRYWTSRLIGIDFDIEAGQTEQVLRDLINASIAAEKRWPNLRFSFTIATLAGEQGVILNPTGVLLMNLLKNSGWNNYFINLMTMNYGTEVRSGICIVGSNGQCDMGLSAINAAKRLSKDYEIPFSRIEITPMIGNNDVVTNIYLLKDVKP